MRIFQRAFAKKILAAPPNFCPLSRAKLCKYTNFVGFAPAEAFCVAPRGCNARGAAAPQRRFVCCPCGVFREGAAKGFEEAVCFLIPLGVSGLWRQRAARRLAGKTGRGGLQPAGAGASEGLCQPHGGYPSRGCGAGAGRCGSVCCRGAGGHREHGGDRGPRLCGRRVRPPCARGHCQGRQHRARADEDRIRHRARTGRGIFTIGGTACLNF